jgi:hypothetical protein
MRACEKTPVTLKQMEELCIVGFETSKTLLTSWNS